MGEGCKCWVRLGIKSPTGYVSRTPTRSQIISETSGCPPTSLAKEVQPGRRPRRPTWPTLNQVDYLGPISPVCIHWHDARVKPTLGLFSISLSLYPLCSPYPSPKPRNIKNTWLIKKAHPYIYEGILKLTLHGLASPLKHPRSR